MNSFLKNITDKVFVNSVNNIYLTPTGCIPMKKQQILRQYLIRLKITPCLEPAEGSRHECFLIVAHCTTIKSASRYYHVLMFFSERLILNHFIFQFFAAYQQIFILKGWSFPKLFVILQMHPLIEAQMFSEENGA